MISVSVKVVVKIKTHILCSTTFPYNPTICEIILKNIIEQDMRIASWITKATDIRSEYVIRIAYSLQQWLRERASLLRLYVHYVSSLCFDFRYVTYHDNLTNKNVKNP